MTLAQLLSGCIFGHGDLLRTRDEQGYLALECADCGKTKRLFHQAAIKSPSPGPRTLTLKESGFANQ